MGALSLLPLSIPRPFLSILRPSRKTRLLLPRDSGLLRSSSVVARSGREPEKVPSAFVDEEGMVKDMDGYLNYLSLEYESVWDTKPSWCQPWTIVATGAGATGCSWVLLRSTLITAVIFSLICVWWYLFLYIYPKTRRLHHIRLAAGHCASAVSVTIHLL